MHKAFMSLDKPDLDCFDISPIGMTPDPLWALLDYGSNEW